MTKVCETCGAEYERPPHYGNAQWESRRYCGQSCQPRPGRRRLGETRTCEAEGCEETFYALRSRPERRFCSQECYHATVVPVGSPRWGEDNPVWKGDQAGDSAKRYRARRRFSLGDCERCGAAGEHRHHRDRDPGNNTPENIEVLCEPCHLAEHNWPYQRWAA